MCTQLSSKEFPPAFEKVAEDNLQKDTYAGEKGSDTRAATTKRNIVTPTAATTKKRKRGSSRRYYFDSVRPDDVPSTFALTKKKAPTPVVATRPDKRARRADHRVDHKGTSRDQRVPTSRQENPEEILKNSNSNKNIDNEQIMPDEVLSVTASLPSPIIGPNTSNAQKTSIKKRKGAAAKKKGFTALHSSKIHKGTTHDQPRSSPTATEGSAPKELRALQSNLRAGAYWLDIHETRAARRQSEARVAREAEEREKEVARLREIKMARQSHQKTKTVKKALEVESDSDLDPLGRREDEEQELDQDSGSGSDSNISTETQVHGDYDDDDEDSNSDSDSKDTKTEDDEVISKKHRHGGPTTEWWNQEWMKSFRLLVAYQKKHKNPTLTKVHMKGLGRLGNWIVHQRTKYRKGILEKERIKLLESIGFEWKMREHFDWMEMYRLLVKHKGKHKTFANAPKPEPQLGSWMHWQRQRYKSGRMEQDRIDLLESVGFELRVRERIDWMKMYKRLVAHKKKYGTTQVPFNKNSRNNKYYRNQDYKQFACWVQRQRTTCKREDRVKLLNKIGFDWQLRVTHDWETMFSRLLAYKEKHGTTYIPESYQADPELAKWVKKQRHRCTNQDRIDRFNEIGFVWDVREYRQKMGLDKLKHLPRQCGASDASHISIYSSAFVDDSVASPVAPETIVAKIKYM